MRLSQPYGNRKGPSIKCAITNMRKRTLKSRWRFATYWELYFAVIMVNLFRKRDKEVTLRRSSWLDEGKSHSSFPSDGINESRWRNRKKNWRKSQELSSFPRKTQNPAINCTKCGSSIKLLYKAQELFKLYDYFYSILFLVLIVLLIRHFLVTDCIRTVLLKVQPYQILASDFHQVSTMSFRNSRFILCAFLKVK